MEFNNMPPEMQLKIFSYLNTKDLCNSATPVCKEWHSLAYDPHLWKSIKFTKFNDKSSRSMNNVLDRCTLLQELKIYSVPDWQFIPHLINCPELRKLKLTRCRDLTARDASQIVQNCPNVEELTIRSCKNIHNSILQELVQWRKLKKIDISVYPHSRSYDDECVNLIANHCAKLEFLDISDFDYLTDNSLQCLTNLRGCTLKKLYLSGCSLTNAGLNSLRECRYLSELKIIGGDLELTEDDMMAIKELKFLHVLHMTCAQDFTETGFSTMFQDNSLNCVIELNLMGCEDIDDEVVQSITKCCLTLKILNLSFCSAITEKGIEAIALNCRCLTELHVSMVKFITCESFNNYPKVLSTLKYLNVVNCDRVKKETIYALVEKTRNTSIHWTDHTGGKAITRFYKAA